MQSPILPRPRAIDSLFALAASLLLGGIAACASGSSEGGVGAADAKPNEGGPDAMIPGRADAAPGIRPDASPIGTPDATPANTADAAPAADADPSCTPVAMNILLNADFDLGPGNWNETSGGNYPLITSHDDITGVTADSGTFVTWLGGYEPALGATDVFYQDVAVPGDASPLAFSGKMWVDSAETLGLPFDTLTLELVNASTGAVLEPLASWSNLDAAVGWVTFNASPSGSFAGQTVRLRWTADFDSTKQTSFLLDTLALTTTACP